MGLKNVSLLKQQMKVDLEKHIGKGANDIHFPLTPQHVVFDLW